MDDVVRARERAARAEPDDAAARAALLLALERAQDVAGLERLADDRPDDPDAGRALARALAAAGRDAEAWAARVRSGTTADADAAPLRDALASAQRPALEGLREALPEGTVDTSPMLGWAHAGGPPSPVATLTVSAGVSSAGACRPALRWITGLGSVIELRMFLPWLDDDDLGFLEALPALDTLLLDHARGFEGHGLASLRRRLRRLSLTAGPVLGSDAFAALERLPRLAALSLRRTSLDPTASLALGRLERLEELDVARCSGLGGPPLEAILRHPGLRVLNAGGQLVVESHVARASLPRLEEVDAFEAKVGSRGLAALAVSARLRALAANGSWAEDALLEALAGHPALELLSLRRARVEGRGLGAIARCHRLRALDVGSGRLDGAHLSALGGAANLVYLGLSGGRVRDEHLSVVRELPALAALDLSGTHITDAALPLLEQLPPSVRIDISGTRTTPAGRSAFHARRPQRLPIQPPRCAEV